MNGARYLEFFIPLILLGIVAIIAIGRKHRD